MITHRFAEAAERRDGAAMAALFAEDVTYHTPTLTTDLHGKELTLRYLAGGTRIVDDLEYTDQVSDDERLILFWKGTLAQREISGVTVLADAAGGLIHDITVLQRPWGVTANFRDGILPALADAVPLPARQLDDRKAPAPDPDAGANRRRAALFAGAGRRAAQRHAHQDPARPGQRRGVSRAHRRHPGPTRVPGPVHPGRPARRVLEVRHRRPPPARNRRLQARRQRTSHRSDRLAAALDYVTGPYREHDRHTEAAAQELAASPPASSRRVQPSAVTARPE